MGGTKTPLERIGTFPDGTPVHRAVDDGFYGHCRVIGGGTDVITPEILRTLRQMKVKGIKRMELSLEEYMAGAVTLTKAVIDVREENPLETAFATRGYTSKVDYINDQINAALEIAGTEDILFLVYGGGEAIEECCKAAGCVYIPERMQAIVTGGDGLAPKVAPEEYAHIKK
mgnify:CR=1 FL=1